VPEIAEDSRRLAWLEARRNGIGGSDAPAVCGVDPWRDALAVWGSKVGLIEAEDLSGNEAVEAGIELERTIGEWYGRKFGRRVTLAEPYVIRRHPEHPFMCCTLDATEERDGETLVVQIKNTGSPADAWEERVPINYEVQLQHEMFVAGATRGVLVALHGGRALRAYERSLTPEIADALVRIETDFWRLVEEQVPPDAGPNSAEALKALFPRVEIEDQVPLPPEADDLDAELLRVKAGLDTLGARRDEIESQIKLWIGHHAGGVTPQGVRFGWKGSEVKHQPREAKVSYVRRFTRSVKK
jgi:putative phage-type endonuclease